MTNTETVSTAESAEQDTVLQQVEALLAPYRIALAADYFGYRNHVLRVIALTEKMPEVHVTDRDLLIVAAVFHDLAIWVTGCGLDYLAPSADLAGQWLAAHGPEAWRDDLRSMIVDHHKLTRSRGRLAEAFRKADLVDVSMGLLRCGLSWEDVAVIRARWPDAGFHRCLARLTWQQCRKTPWRPAPMIRW